MDAATCHNAFKTILLKSVNVDQNKEITVLYDEFFFPYFKTFSQVVNEMLLKVTYIFVPDAYQQVLQGNEIFYENDEINLPRGINVAVGHSDIVLNFLKGSAPSSKVRGAVPNYIRNNGCKLIHCPKLNDDVLDLVIISDFEKVHKDCELIAWALGNANSATIITTSPDGKEEKLNIRLGSWDNDPFISSGIIMENSWGNVPPGETFCCPRAGTVNGTIYINGSIPGHVFGPDEFFCLNFNKGKISSSSSSPNPKISGFLGEMEKSARQRNHNDNNWNNFAELGIGLNPAIKHLTGNSLFDEKMAGTLHVAIGDNFVFGHYSQSEIHADLTIKDPTLFLDDLKVIDKGRLDVGLVTKWRNEFTPSSHPDLEGQTIVFKQAKIHYPENGVQRKLNKGNRIGYIDVFTPKQNKKLMSLGMNELNQIRYTDLAKKAKKILKQDELNTILNILIHYRMAVLK